MLQSRELSVSKISYAAIVILLVSIFATQTDASATTVDACEAAIQLDLNATFRGYGYEDQATQFFRLDIESPGIVSLEISVPGFAEVLPKIGLLRDPCSSFGSEGRRADVLERSATHLLLAVHEPGTYYLRAGAQDQRQFLQEFKLRTGHMVMTSGFDPTLPAEEKPIQVDPDPNLAEEKPIQVDPDPNLVQIPIPPAEEKPIQVDPDPNLVQIPIPPAEEKPIQVDPDPNLVQIPIPPAEEKPIQVDPDPNLALWGERFCASEDSDDHSGAMSCATPLDQSGSVVGELANGWGDDEDMFVFTIRNVATVHVGTLGATDTFGILYDSTGLRLAAADDGGEGDNFLIVRTLNPGRYFVRVEGNRRAQGDYEIELRSTEW